MSNFSCPNGTTLIQKNIDDADKDVVANTVGAIICVIISSFSTTFGLFFQKIAQNRGGICGKKDDTKAKKHRAFAYWFGGFMMITFISFGLDLYAMGSLGQSVVVPLLAGLEVRDYTRRARRDGGGGRHRCRTEGVVRAQGASTHCGAALHTAGY
jgi:hypothetical protein